MKKRLIQLTDELWASIDDARAANPANPWIEKQLWKVGPVQSAAKRLGLKRPDRPADGRGKKKVGAK